MCSSHPTTIWKLIEGLKKEQGNTEIILTRCVNTDITTKKYWYKNVTQYSISSPLHGKINESYICFWEFLLLMVAHYDLCRLEESLSSNNSNWVVVIGISNAVVSEWRRQRLYRGRCKRWQQWSISHVKSVRKKKLKLYPAQKHILRYGFKGFRSLKRKY